MNETRIKQISERALRTKARQMAQKVKSCATSDQTLVIFHELKRLHEGRGYSIV